MIFFSDNLCYIKFFSEMYYHVFSTKVDQEGGSIHKKKNLFPEKMPLIRINIICTFFRVNCCVLVSSIISCHACLLPKLVNKYALL